MRGFLAVALSAFSVLAIGSSAKAETTVFENGFFFITEGTFDDIYVGSGAIVGLIGNIHVTGDIEVTGGAWFTASGITVLGEIESEGTAIFDLEHSTVAHDVEISYTGGEPVLGLLPNIFVADNSIGGDLEVKKNNVNFIIIQDNRIGGSLELSKNVSNFGTISNNLTHLKKSRKSK